MITLTPEMAIERFGKLFSRKYLVMVDERAGIAEILEQCHARGTIEWDAVNRIRAGGAVERCTIDGSTMIMRARLGKHPVRFGAANSDLGGQALEGVEVMGDEVASSFAGIAGAGMGIAACLPQAPGVLRAEYPSDEDLNVGGARTNRVRIYSPRYEKVTIGIDDTDTKQEGATWVLALKAAEACVGDGVDLLSMRVVQLNPKVPIKTSNCVGSALNFAVRPQKIETFLEALRTYVLAHTKSVDTGIAVYRGIDLAKSEYGRRVKTDLLSLDEIEIEADRLGIQFIDQNHRKGRIGSFGAVLWANQGPEAAALYGEHL